MGAGPRVATGANAGYLLTGGNISRSTRPTDPRAAFDATWPRAQLLKDTKEARLAAMDKGSYTAVAQLTKQESDLIEALEQDWRKHLDNQPRTPKSAGDIAARIPALVANMSPALFSEVCRAVDARRNAT